MGEAADPEVVAALKATVGTHPQVRRVVDLITVQLGAEQVFAAFTLEFPDEMTIPDLERLIGTIGEAVRRKHPEVTRIFVRPEPRTHATAAGILSPLPMPGRSSGSGRSFTMSRATHAD